MTQTQPADAQSPFIRPADLAALLDLSPETIYRRIADETIPATRIGRLWLIPRTYLDQLLEPVNN